MAPLPATGEITIQKDIVYRSDGDLRLAYDLYRPAKISAVVPVVIFVNGIGAPWMRGHAQYTGWAQAVTARGLAGITMDSREATVDDDVRAVIAHLTANANPMGLDASRVALWSCSANVRRGLPLAQSLGAPVRSAVVYYGTAEQPAYRRDLPVLFVRAGQDGAGLNRGLEAMVAKALADNAPVEAINVAAGVHGFDVRDDTEATRATISQTLDFLAKTLRGPFLDSVQAGADLASAAAAVYREDWSAAALAYEGLVAAHPRDSLLWERLGEALRAKGEGAAALKAFEQALAIGSPNRGLVSFAAATIYAEGNRLDDAFKVLEGMRPQLRFFAARLRTEPVFETLRHDRRFDALMKDVPPPPRDASDVRLRPVWTLPGLSAPESVALGADGSFLYVSNVNGEADEVDGNGFISRVSVDGKLLQLKWAVGLDGPKGLVLKDKRLFVADIKRLVEIDAATGKTVAKYDAPGAKFLNDVVLTPDGRVLASDSANARIYELENGRMRVLLQDGKLDSVNGLRSEPGRLVITTMKGLLLAMDWKTRTLSVLATGLGDADGIAPLTGGRYLVTEWPGRLFEVLSNGTSTVLLDSRAAKTYLNDILLVGDTLYVPHWEPGALTAYRVSR